MIKKLIKIIRYSSSDPRKKAKLHQKDGVKMGDNCQVYGGCSFGSEPYLIELGSNVKITSGCQFITHDGGVEVLRNLYQELKKCDVFKPIKIGSNVFFGNGCIILPGVEIGDNVIVGAGSIVTKSFPSNSIIAGVPAKKIKDIVQYKKEIVEKCVYTKEMNQSEKKRYLLERYQIKNFNNVK